MKFLLKGIFIGFYIIGFPLISNSQTQNQPQGSLQPSSSQQTENIGLNKVEDISFEALDGAGVVTITTSAPAEYEQLSKGEGKVSIKLEDVYLPPELQVSRDVKDFDSPVNFVASFSDPVKGSDVIVAVELKEEVSSQVQQIGNVIKIKLGKTTVEKLAEEKGAEVVVEEERGPIWAFDFRTATTPGAKKAYRGQLVSFDFKDADIRDVLRILADISGFNIIVSSDVKGSVTLKLANVPWDQALDVVIEDSGLGAFVEGNVVKVA
ncbi:MAG: secretin and TonB N-terminal domain-containing protein, partial [Thermodesulfobacteriota bacterium]